MPKPTRRSLRLAVLSNSLPTPGRSSGGVAQVAHDLAGGLARRGHEVTVWTYEGNPGPAPYGVRSLPASGFATSRLGRFLTEGYVGNLFAPLPRYREADAIIAMGDSLLLPILRKPLVRVVHGTALQEALSSRKPIRILSQLGIYPLELLAAAMQSGSVAVSENTRRHNPFVRRVIPNGIDLSMFSPGEDGKSTEPSILFVGALGSRKRGGLLLEWFVNRVLPQLPAATLTIVGAPGPKPDGVVYRTGISTAELASLYRRSWVYASPSIYEGFGLPYVEAMASGTPVIATSNPGSREILADGRYGILATDEAFSDALLHLLQNPAECERLAALGLQRAADYSLDRMIDAYEELLLRLVTPA